MASSTQPTARVLIVDAETLVGDALGGFLRESGYQTDVTSSAETALDVIRRTRTSPHSVEPFAVAVIDLNLPGMSGMELIRRLREEAPEIVPLVTTGYGTIESAIEAIRLGASDYLLKPLVDAEFLIAVERALRQHALLAENSRLRKQLDARHGLDGIVGQDPRMRRIFDLVEAVAPTRTTVLMSGESGTGKSMIARAIHQRSPRRDRPFVEIACGSIPETLLESELFGHVKGSFTGAHADKPGRFLAANGGTIFLDEINSASPAMQLKLLRVLQEKRFEPVGSSETVEVDVRVILASNQPLEELVARGEFRQDLYYRINVVMVEVPPLRSRASDIPLLAAHFLEQFARDAGREVVGFTDEAMNALRGYAFPGNVRELQNIIERAVVLSRSARVQLDDLPPNVTGEAPRSFTFPTEPYQPMTLEEALREPERRIILATLEHNAWNRQRTADVLGINRTTLYKKMKQLGLDEFRAAAG